MKASEPKCAFYLNWSLQVLQSAAPLSESNDHSHHRDNDLI